MKTGRVDPATGDRHDHREWYDSHNEVSAARQQSHAATDHPFRDPQRSTKTGRLIPQHGTGMITENGLTQRLTQAVSSLTHGYSYMPCAAPADSTGAVRHHTRRRHGRRSQQARRHTLVSAAVGRPPNTTRRQAPP